MHIISLLRHNKIYDAANCEFVNTVFPDSSFFWMSKEIFTEDGEEEGKPDNIDNCVSYGRECWTHYNMFSPVIDLAGFAVYSGSRRKNRMERLFLKKDCKTYKLDIFKHEFVAL